MPRLRRKKPPTAALAAALTTSLLLAAGCASSDAPRLHSLLAALPAAGNAAPAASAAPPLYIDLPTVGVPAAVDQPQWVVRTADDTLRMLEQERWVAPLRDELRAALLDGLVRRWNATDLRNAPGTSGLAGWRLRVDVQRFETVAGSGAWLDATWSAVPTPGGNGSKAAPGPANTLNCRSSLREPAGADPVALATAHRRAVGRLADQIGAALSKLASEDQPPACPGNA